MKALVSVKRVVDYSVRVRIKPDGSGVAVARTLTPLSECLGRLCLAELTWAETPVLRQAEHLGVPVLWVRVFFGVTAVFGFGVVLYAALWDFRRKGWTR